METLGKKAPARRKNTQAVKAKKEKIFYYRIYDDKEEFSYLKSILNHEQVQEIINSYEKRRKQYLNCTLIKSIQKVDADAELIKVEDISY